MLRCRFKDENRPDYASWLSVFLSFLALTTGLLLSHTQAATLVVSNVNDSGVGSLRQALIDANNAIGLDTITFQIPGSGVHTILPGSALPAVQDPVIIDGTTQSGYVGQPLIEINGASTGNSGLRLQAGNSTVKALIINRCAADGITISGTGTNVILGCYLGPDSSGAGNLGNIHEGVSIIGSSWNVIGGTNANDRNVISENGDTGIYISGGTNNLIQGNYIGLNASGNPANGNTNNGVIIAAGSINATGNLVGGTNAAQRNWISGNGGSGVYITSVGGLNGSVSSNNVVQGNYVGISVAGIGTPNAGDGVTLQQTTFNLIGGTNTGAGNVLSGNSKSGVSFFGSAFNNMVQGNVIGADPAGTLAIPNKNSGVTIFNSGNNLIGGTNSAARNIISGNLQDGVFITNSTANTVSGNYIGLNAIGTGSISNLANGIEISGCNSNVIGGNTAGARNVISGNGGNGVGVFYVSSGNIISGNYIGLIANSPAAGTALSNTLCGVRIESASNTVGGTSSGAGNVISGNGLDGVLIINAGASNNAVQGNIIGLGPAANAKVGNLRAGIGISACRSNLIGGTLNGSSNVIGGNASSPTLGLGGVYIAGPGANGNVVQGNIIGTDPSGVLALGNNFDGIALYQADTNTIGGSISGTRNLISDNHSDGIYLATSSWNLIQGNLIGTMGDGINNRGNWQHNVELEVGCANNIIGGLGTAANTIAFAGSVYAGVRVRDGATNNAILGNSIFSNAALGIDLGTVGVTVNDHCDADSGANNLQNFPIITQAVSGTYTGVRGTLDSKASSSFRLQFFASPTCDSSGNGEGQIFLGEAAVSTSSLCSNSFLVTVPLPAPPGYMLTATATDSSNNTSEFSPCVAIGPTPSLSEVRTNGNQLSLSWTNTATGFVLKQTGSLSPPVAWTSVTNAIGTNNGRFFVNVPIGPTNQFFALRFE